MNKATIKINRALRILNATMPQPKPRRYRTVYNRASVVCPVCHDPKCELEWSDEAHEAKRPNDQAHARLNNP